MSLLTELDASYTEHRRCGELEARITGPMVWMSCSCGGTVARRDPAHINGPPPPDPRSA